MSEPESQSGPDHNGSSQQQPPAQSRTLTCYNCGAEDHFMTACPEPTRTIPAYVPFSSVDILITLKLIWIPVVLRLLVPPKQHRLRQEVVLLLKIRIITKAKDAREASMAPW
jgi:hypothetical protein